MPLEWDTEDIKTIKRKVFETEIRKRWEILSCTEMPHFSVGCICSSALGNILKLMVIIIAVTLHRLRRCSRPGAAWHQLCKQCTCLTKRASSYGSRDVRTHSPIKAGPENTEGLSRCACKLLRLHPLIKICWASMPFRILTAGRRSRRQDDRQDWWLLRF